MPPIFIEHPDTQRATVDRMAQVRGQALLARSQVAANPNLVLSVASLAQAYGASGLPPGVITAAAMNGLTPGDPRMDQLARDSVVAMHEPGGLVGTLWGGITGIGRGLKSVTGWAWDESGMDSALNQGRVAIRAAFAGFDAAFNEIVGRPFRTMVGYINENVPNSVYLSGDVEPGPKPLLGARSIQPQGRSLYGVYKDSGESALTSAWREWRETGNPNVGSGYFIGEQAGQRAMETNRLRYRDDLISPGRFYGGMVFEPGTQPYHLASGTIDAAAQIALDPAAIALGGVGAVADARRAFRLPQSITNLHDAKAYFGAARGHRGDVNVGMYVDRFLNQERAGRSFVQRMAETTDAEDIWESLGRHRNRRTVRELRDTSSPDAIKQGLARHLGVDARERPRSNLRQAVRETHVPFVHRSIQDMRWLDEIPGQYLNAEDLDETLETWNQWLKNANLPTDVRKDLFNRYVDLDDGDHRGLYALVAEASAHIDDVILRDPTLFDHLPNAFWDSRRRMGTNVLDMFVNEVDEYRKFKEADVLPALSPTSSLTVNGRRVVVPDPTDYELEEMMARGLALPDFREIRRATSKLAPLLDSGIGRPTVGLFETVMKVWKPLQLLRVAWTVRVLGEEVGARLGAAGLDSPFHHPADWIGFVIAGRDDWLSNLLRKIPSVEDKGLDDILDSIITQSDEMRAAMSSDAAGWAGEVNKRAKRGDLVEYTRVGKRGRGIVVSDKEFLDHFAMRLRDLWQDPIARKIAMGDEFTWQVGVDFDEAGEVWYHGTPSNEMFQVRADFDGERAHFDIDAFMGAHLTDNPSVAREYARPDFDTMGTQRLRDNLNPDVDTIRRWLDPQGGRGLFDRERFEALVDEVGPEEAARQWADYAVDNFAFAPINVANAMEGTAGGRVFRANARVTNPYTGARNWRDLNEQAIRHWGDTVEVNEFRRLFHAAPGDWNVDTWDDLVARHGSEREAIRGYVSEQLDAHPQMPGAFGFDAMNQAIGVHYRDHLASQGYDGILMNLDASARHLIAFTNDQIIQEGFGGARMLTGADAVKHWFWSNAEGSQIRANLAQASGTTSRKMGLVDDEVARTITINGQPAYTSAREAADAYIDSVRAQVENLTGNNPDLLAAIAAGKIGDVTLKHLGEFTSRFGQTGIPKGERSTLRDLLAPHLDAAPATVLGIDKTIQQSGRWNRFVETMFDALMSTPSDTLSRAPAFRQFYWKRLDELAPRVDASLADDLVSKFTDNNIKFANAGKVGKGGVLITDFETLDAIAKQYALEEVRKLLYSMDRRGQWSDILRNVIPFGEAWKEVLGTWRRLLTHRPKNIRRFQQIVQGARGNDQDPSTGFFHTDPQSGREVFSYPLVGRAMSTLLGGTGTPVNVTAQGDARGLNLVTGSFLPGVGPLASVAVSALLPDTPDWDWLRDTILPYGEDSIRGEGGLGSWVEVTAAPAYMEKALAALFNDDADRRYANMRMAVYESYMNQGYYRPHEVDEAIRATAAPARGMLLLQALAQFILPTGPDVNHELLGHSGMVTEDGFKVQKWYDAQVLAMEFRKMAEETGSFDAAIPMFFERFGVDPLLVSQPSSRTVKERSYDSAGWAWERSMQHKKAIADYTLGYFAPVDPDGEFAIGAWLDAMTEGATVPLTAEQQAYLYNNSVGQAQYRHAKTQIEAMPDLTTEQKRDLLAQYRVGLRVALPGFDTISPTLPSRPDLENLIDELRNAAGDPDLGATPAGQAIRAYLDARDQVVARADGGSLEGERDLALRAALYRYGNQVAQSVPDFRKVWVEVLGREVEDVAQVAQVGLGQAQFAQTSGQ